MAALEFPTLA